MQNIYREQIIKLKEYGLVLNEEKTLVTFLKIKHYSRLLPFIKLMNEWGLTPFQDGIMFIYRIDVILRRMILEELKPIEVSLATSIANYFQVKEYRLDEVLSGKYASSENYWISIGANWERKKSKLDYLKTEMEALCRRRKYSVGELVMELTFGQKIAILTLINSNDLEKHFNIFKNRYHLEHLRRIKSYRNLIAHHHSIIPRQWGRTILISEFIESLDAILGRNFKTRFKEKIDAYKNNFIKKLDVSNNNIEIELLKLLFTKLLEWLCI